MGRVRRAVMVRGSTSSTLRILRMFGGGVDVWVCFREYVCWCVGACVPTSGAATTTQYALLIAPHTHTEGNPLSFVETNPVSSPT